MLFWVWFVALLTVLEKGSHMKLRDTIAFDCRNEIKDKNVQFKIYINDINIMDMIQEVEIQKPTKVVRVKTIGDKNE